jgi:Flp pilus assembly pilin Flp
MSKRPKRADLLPMDPSGRTDRIRTCWRHEEAQTMAEYVVVLAVITPAIILAFGLFASAIVPAFDAVRSFL